MEPDRFSSGWLAKEMEAMKKLYIVTGANGFLGNHLVRKLTADPEQEVRALILPGDPVKALAGLPCQVYFGDVTQKESLREIFQTSGDEEVCVIHCAAVVSIKSKRDPKLWQVNVEGTKNVGEMALKTGAKMVCVNSVHAIPEQPAGQVITEVSRFDPNLVKGYYAKTKAAAAQCVLEMVKNQGLNACIVHPSGMLGPGDFGNSHLTQLVIDFSKGRLTACVKGGYDFVDVRDVADGVLSACQRGKSGECYILSNKRMEVRQLLDEISHARHAKKIRIVLPMWVAKLTAPLSEIYYALLKQPPLYTRYSLYTLSANSLFSHEKASRALGYQPRALQETVVDTVNWLRESGRIP